MTSESGREQLVVGRIGRPHGLRGEVIVEVRTDEPDRRFALGSVLATDPASYGPLTVASHRRIGGNTVLSFDGYHDLWQWSVDDIEAFCASIWDFFEVEAERPYKRVLGRREMPGAEWFPGARLSYAEHIFRDRDDAAVAMIHESEARDRGEVTWGELLEQVAGIAAGLREMGVGHGDRVVGYLPNIPETIAIFLACASIGATWSCCSPHLRSSG